MQGLLTDSATHTAMMNKYFAAALLCAIAACNKPLPDNDPGPFDYTIAGADSITLPANDRVSFSWSAGLVSGDPTNEPISVSITGLPANVEGTPSVSSFRVNYAPGYTLIARNATPGSYPVSAVFTNAATGTKTHKFNLTITAPINRTAKICGGYYPSNNCGNAVYVSCEIDSIQGIPGKIMLIDRKSKDGSYGTFDTCYGYVDCCANTFVIPAQTVSGATVSGDGTFNGQSGNYGTILLNKTTVTDTATYKCTVTLSK